MLNRLLAIRIYPPHYIKCSVGKQRGFTLAELLIALVILGVIATFTIPKVLTAQQSNKSNAMAKEAAGMISGAYQACKKENSYCGDPWVLTPYMNYVKWVTTGLIDSYPTATSRNCATNDCITLHNGASMSFSGSHNMMTYSTMAYFFYVDPDGVYSGSTADSPGKSVEFALYTDGRLTTRQNLIPGTYTGMVAQSACAGCDPSWFGWN